MRCSHPEYGSETVTTKDLNVPNYNFLPLMKNTPTSLEKYLSIINQLVPEGWLPVGSFGSMVFRKNGKNYDLSAADLSQLELIERQGLFIKE